MKTMNKTRIFKPRKIIIKYIVASLIFCYVLFFILGGIVIGPYYLTPFFELHKELPAKINVININYLVQEKNVVGLISIKSKYFFGENSELYKVSPTVLFYKNFDCKDEVGGIVIGPYLDIPKLSTGYWFVNITEFTPNFDINEVLKAKDIEEEFRRKKDMVTPIGVSNTLSIKVKAEMRGGNYPIYLGKSECYNYHFVFPERITNREKCSNDNLQKELGCDVPKYE